MELTLDLHSHSGYSGGVGNIELSDIVNSMKLKGLDIFGTGDALHPQWLDHLKKNLIETREGIFYYQGADKNKYFILQTEIIVSYPLLKKRKSFHLLLFFPSYKSIDKIVSLFAKWGVKNTIGRPFILCSSLQELSNRLFKIKEVDAKIEVIPAHVLTPDGVMGSDNPIASLEEGFGDFWKNIHMIETGLSADPQILEMIPEFQNLTFISNSDCHSADLRRIGREYTKIKVSELSYPSIINALRNNQDISTGEFSILEGRYFLTGHRKGKIGHEQKAVCYYPKETPNSKVCPVCKKPLTVGVLERTLELVKKQGGKLELPQKTKRSFITIVPLIDVIAYGLAKTHTAKVVRAEYNEIVTHIKPEIDFWGMNLIEMTSALNSLKLNEKLIHSILEVKKGNFTYKPIGFDGSYGELFIGEKADLNSMLPDAWQ